jgi:hypothetical protein
MRLQVDIMSLIGKKLLQAASDESGTRTLVSGPELVGINPRRRDSDPVSLFVPETLAVGTT